MAVGQGVCSYHVATTCAGGEGKRLFELGRGWTKSQQCIGRVACNAGCVFIRAPGHAVLAGTPPTAGSRPFSPMGPMQRETRLCGARTCSPRLPAASRTRHWRTAAHGAAQNTRLLLIPTYLGSMPRPAEATRGKPRPLLMGTTFEAETVAAETAGARMVRDAFMPARAAVSTAGGILRNASLENLSKGITTEARCVCEAFAAAKLGLSVRPLWAGA